MSSALTIRIIGGLFGGAITTYIGKKIYDFINKPPPPPPNPLYLVSTKSLKNNDVKSFQEILYKNIDKYNYEYDNEHSNSVEFK